MAPAHIQRLRFFDQQYLAEIDFKDEQTYHMHMRRRLNFALFERGGVVPLGPNDLRLFVIDPTAKTFGVHAGMAIGRNVADREGKEIVLRADSAVLDLKSAGISAGGTAYVTIHYEQDEVKEPPSEGDVDANTRVREEPQLTIHPALPPATAPNGEEYILLGKLDFDTMTLNHTVRQQGRIRRALVAIHG